MTAPREVFLELVDAVAGDRLDTRSYWLERFDQAAVDQIEHAPTTTDLPYEEVDAPITVDLGEQGELLLIDTVLARSTILAGKAGTVPFALPIVILDLQQGRGPATAPLQVERIGITGTADSLRRIGKLLRDACYGAANAAEGK